MAVTIGIVASFAGVSACSVEEQNELLRLIAKVLHGFCNEDVILAHIFTSVAVLNAVSWLVTIEAVACEGGAFYISNCRDAVTALGGLTFAFATFSTF